MTKSEKIRMAKQIRDGGVAVILQGKLEGNILTEGGIAAQPKSPPKVAAAA